MEVRGQDPVLMVSVQWENVYGLNIDGFIIDVSTIIISFKSLLECYTVCSASSAQAKCPLRLSELFQETEASL